jgi:hypothetical protein
LIQCRLSFFNNIVFTVRAISHNSLEVPRLIWNGSTIAIPGQPEFIQRAPASQHERKGERLELRGAAHKQVRGIRSPGHFEYHVKKWVKKCLGRRSGPVSGQGGCRSYGWVLARDGIFVREKEGRVDGVTTDCVSSGLGRSR